LPKGITRYTKWVTTLTLDTSSPGQAGTATPTKRVLLLKPRGFCAGVVRAIDIVQIALETFGAPTDNRVVLTLTPRRVVASGQPAA